MGDTLNVFGSAVYISCRQQTGGTLYESYDLGRQVATHPRFIFLILNQTHSHVSQGSFSSKVVDKLNLPICVSISLNPTIFSPAMMIVRRKVWQFGRPFQYYIHMIMSLPDICVTNSFVLAAIRSPGNAMINSPKKPQNEKVGNSTKKIKVIISCLACNSVTRNRINYAV